MALFFSSFQYNNCLLYVTGFVKTNPNLTRTEIHFPNIKAVYTLALPRRTKHMAEDDQICFHRRPFATLVILEVHYRACEASGWH